MPRIALAALAVLGLLLAPAAASAQAPADTTPILRVVGHGSAEVTPDSAQIFARVSARARSAETARAVVARGTRRLLAALDELGVPRADVQTSGVSVDRRRLRKPKRIRWAAHSSIDVVVRDVARAGATFDALVAAGATNVEGPYVEVANPSAGLAAAEQAALADARARADAIAATLGLRVAGVRSVDLSPGEGGDVDRGSMSDSAAVAAAPEPTPVEPGRERVSASVAVVYVLAPAA